MESTLMIDVEQCEICGRGEGGVGKRGGKITLELERPQACCGGERRIRALLTL